MLRRARLLITVAAAAPLVLLGVPGAASADGGGSTTVLVPRSDCGRPTAGEVSCFAQHLVKKRVAASRAGTYPRPSAAVGDGPAGGYAPAELAKAYGISAGSASGAQQVVAIVDAYHSPNALDHLNTFDAHYGLPAESQDSFRVVNDSGAASPLPTQTDEGWAGETDLDLQAVRGMCHQCKILLVEADEAAQDALAAGVNSAAAYRWTSTDGATTLPVRIVSNSYGGSEYKNDTFAASYNHPKVAILASTGDEGWFDWDWANTYFADNDASNDVDPGTVANAPATYNSVIGVGGTTLRLTSSNTRSSETTWNRNGNTDSVGVDNGPMGAGGSGCSQYVSGRSFQTKVAGYSGLGCSTKRSSVDVAALADPYTGYDVYTTADGQTGWSRYGGTSLAAPLVAGMWAIAGGPGGTAYPAANLYKHFAAKTKRGLYDVTVGGNGLCGLSKASSCKSTVGQDPNTLFGSPRVPLACEFAWGSHKTGSTTYQCHARKGYDGVSGVGSPAGVYSFKP